MSDLTEKLAEVIPSVYYDIIARVLPGMVTVVGMLWAVCYPFARLQSDTGVGETTLVLAGIALGYVVGILLTNVGALVSWLISRAMTLLARPWPNLKKYGLQDLWSRIDAVNKRAPSAGATLAKMAAEVVLCQNLLVASLIVLTLADRPIPVLEGSLIVTLLLCSVAVRTVILRKRLDSLESSL